MPLLAPRRRPASEPGPAPLVRLREAAVRAGETQLLAPISLEVEPGEIVAVTGPNGSGKTTLLRLVAGLTPPSSGTVEIAGRSVSERDRLHRRRVAALVGTPPFERDLTLAEHLAMVALSWGAPLAEARRTAVASLDALGLGALASRFPHELSSGQTQLLSLALVLARPGEVLLLDEPEQRLDVDRVPLVIEVLREAARGRAVLIATHNPLLTSALATRVLELSGR
ncbi:MULTISPECIES: ABC transporter ATP-binding protein [unclassified Rathayibacter]|uniref:ABC transporter ATP-binding protein n=1 Tax=unclassified Rathayibacter TaxID=2609250 RepID=UPI001FB24C48|nr:MULTISPECIES: ABC transporter ATP-binding protein [unclassified Rathayibacter]MCJ1672262.1 ABC transporter ATP-binding protein [Rathayibacter sp. VKM Ac-2929]MCJ1685157.1 ABC transporter ATP-binding protein [Rathayibacter sp. VKM Ac-2928]